MRTGEGGVGGAQAADGVVGVGHLVCTNLIAVFTYINSALPCF